MSYSSDEKRLFNAALGNIDAVNRELVKIYEKAKANVDSRLAVYRQQREAGQITPENEPFRREALSSQIQTEIDALYKQMGEYQTRMFDETYSDTYYGHAYNVEKAINTEIPGLPNDYYLNYPILPTETIRAALEKDIAGHTFSDRIGQDKLVMQFRVKSAVAQVLAEGQTVQQLAKRLAGIDEAFAVSQNKAITTARTELLRAYSYGQDEARQEAEAAGVTFTYKWDAALDGLTRPDHRAMDGKKAAIVDDNPVFTLPDGSKAAGPRMPGLPAGQSINCRCRRLDLPYGIEPTERVAKLPSGEWTKVASNTTADEWYNSKYNGGTKTNIQNPSIQGQIGAKKDLYLIVKEKESLIANDKKENCFAFDDDGNVLFNKSGKKDRISFSSEEIVKIRGARIFTHNHPGNGVSFSHFDLNFMGHANIKEMRVTSKDYEYSIKNLNGDNTFLVPDNRRLIFSEYTKAVKLTRIDFFNKLQRGEITRKPTDVEFQHAVVERLSTKWGFAYEQRKR